MYNYTLEVTVAPMQLSSNNLPGSEFMIWRGVGCCCSIITRSFHKTKKLVDINMVDKKCNAAKFHK